MCHVLSHIRLFVTLWTVARQAPGSMGFSRQEYWSGLPFPPPGDLPDPGIEPVSLASPSLSGRFFTTSTTWEAWSCMTWIHILNFVALNQLVNLSGPVFTELSKAWMRNIGTYLAQCLALVMNRMRNLRPTQRVTFSQSLIYSVFLGT